MSTAKTIPSALPDAQVQFPVACKTWAEVDEIKRKYLKPIRFGPKGQPIYDHDEVARHVIFPIGESQK